MTIFWFKSPFCTKYLIVLVQFSEVFIEFTTFNNNISMQINQNKYFLVKGPIQIPAELLFSMSVFCSGNSNMRSLKSSIE